MREAGGGEEREREAEGRERGGRVLVTNVSMT